MHTMTQLPTDKPTAYAELETSLAAGPGRSWRELPTGPELFVPPRRPWAPGAPDRAAVGDDDRARLD